MCLYFYCNAGKGIPNVRMNQDNRTAKVSPHIIPSPDEAVASYHNLGGRLTLVSTFGEDPLPAPLRIVREHEFLTTYPDFEVFFTSAVNGREQPFRSGLQHFLSITKRLAQ